jgi:hypothetical protein
MVELTSPVMASDRDVTLTVSRVRGDILPYGAWPGAGRAHGLMLVRRRRKVDILNIERNAHHTVNGG